MRLGHALSIGRDTTEPLHSLLFPVLAEIESLFGLKDSLLSVSREFPVRSVAVVELLRLFSNSRMSAAIRPPSSVL